MSGSHSDGVDVIEPGRCEAWHASDVYCPDFLSVAYILVMDT